MASSHLSDSHPEYLIRTEQLAQQMQGNASDLRIFDVTVQLVPNPPAGYKAVSGLDDYLAGHIPGANFMDLIRGFSDTSSGLGFTLPAPEVLQSAYQAAGINADTQVVFYSSGHMMWATRAWWMLHSCGHEKVAVLDGGLAAWTSEGRETVAGIEPYPKGDFGVTFNPACWVDKSATQAAIEDAGICLINALSPGVYTGEAEMNYGRKGHIPNSKNVYYDEVLQEGAFRAADELRTIFSEKGVLGKPRVIAYCGGGISATIDALALKMIGHPNVAVYDGSMSEWVRDENLALVTGPEPQA